MEVMEHVDDTLFRSQPSVPQAVLYLRLNCGWANQHFLGGTHDATALGCSHRSDNSETTRIMATISIAEEMCRCRHCF